MEKLIGAAILLFILSATAVFFALAWAVFTGGVK